MKRSLLCLLTFTLLVVPNEFLQANGIAPTASIAPHAPPPPAPENPPPAPPAASAPDLFSSASLHRFVLAFLHARSTANIDEELRFFAGEVDYRGQAHIERSEIRRDLERSRQRWPERSFTLTGDLQIERQTEGRVRLTIPLRYELRNGTRQKTGETREIILLARTAPNELLIVALSGGPGA